MFDYLRKLTKNLTTPSSLPRTDSNIKFCAETNLGGGDMSAMSSCRPPLPFNLRCQYSSYKRPTDYTLVMAVIYKRICAKTHPGCECCKNSCIPFGCHCSLQLDCCQRQGRHDMCINPLERKWKLKKKH